MSELCSGVKDQLNRLQIILVLVFLYCYIWAIFSHAQHYGHDISSCNQNRDKTLLCNAKHLINVLCNINALFIMVVLLYRSHLAAKRCVYQPCNNLSLRPSVYTTVKIDGVIS